LRNTRGSYGGIQNAVANKRVTSAATTRQQEVADFKAQWLNSWPPLPSPAKERQQMVEQT